MKSRLHVTLTLLALILHCGCRAAPRNTARHAFGIAQHVGDRAVGVVEEGATRVGDAAGVAGALTILGLSEPTLLPFTTAGTLLVVPTILVTGS